jgi:hypothetical protein
MESKGSAGETYSSQSELGVGQGDEGEQRSGPKDCLPGVQRILSADPSVFPGVPANAGETAVPAEPVPPVWVQRLWLIIYVVFCIELGMLLIVLPWKPVWHANALLTNYPTLKVLFQNYFLRGLVTGLGVIDIWLGVSEAVHYRERKPPAGR